ncbi:MAG: tetratricopeptide repeat-containing sensor histidine kinase [Bacteroidota bacterium]
MIYSILFIILLLAVPQETNTIEEPQIDSLRQSLQDADYQQRLNLLEQLCEHYAPKAPERTIVYALQLLKEAESKDNLEYLDVATSFLGEAYFFIDEPENSEHYFLYLLDINKRQKDTLGLASAYNNLAILYSSEEAHHKALDYYHQSLNIKKRLRDTAGISTTYNNIGVTYFYMQQYTKALDYYKRSFALEKATDNAEGIATSYLNMGEVKGKLHRYEEAIQELKRSIALSDSLNDEVTMEIAHECLYDVHKERGDYQQALLHYEALNLLKSKRIAERRNHQIEELQVQYETAKKQKEIALLNKQKSNQQLVITVQLGLILVILILLALVLRLLKTKTRISQKLKTQNEQIKQQHTTLQATNATRDKFFSIIAHDLKGAIGGFLGQTQFMAEDFRQLKEREKQEMISVLHSSAQQLYALLENLLAWSRTQLGSIDYKPKAINIESLIREVLALHESNIQEKNLSVSCVSVEPIMVYADYNMLSTVLRNLLSNAIKYSFEGGQIIISTTRLRAQNKVNISISDKGKGITPKKQQQLFQLERTVSEPGTNKEQGTGLGLILCKEFVEKNRGTLHFQSTPNKGTRFFFELPLFADNQTN